MLKVFFENFLDVCFIYLFICYASFGISAFYYLLISTLKKES